VGECFFWYQLTRVVPDKGPYKMLAAAAAAAAAVLITIVY